ncbi:hypothetical protein C482_04074 [Natrialba chahannaoensis JCM 10990]|uniref:DUF5518 domain-containing protein n=1 Tax=Natrialba chahannaoensis JCM 10990 TaxID=1227492 RepID=M0AXX2_9EURY|nr:DUF5518 domain-containing protein [Natrialba chahannaoensis]ELZ03167.1 hypothetical protein C482_04074 [Natrialba chahannaoensis JCM 10990]
MSRGRTAINALIGAVVAVVLSFIPFSTIIGGAVAGFLEGPETRDGVLAGALAGAIMFVPVVGIALFFLGFMGFGFGVAAVPFEGFVVVLAFFGLLSTVVLLYTVGLSLLGGVLGSYLAREFPSVRHRTNQTLGTEPPRREGPRGRRVRSPRASRATGPTDSSATHPDRADRSRSPPNGPPSSDRSDRSTRPDRYGSTATDHRARSDTNRDQDETRERGRATDTEPPADTDTGDRPDREAARWHGDDDDATDADNAAGDDQVTDDNRNRG